MMLNGSLANALASVSPAQMARFQDAVRNKRVQVVASDPVARAVAAALISDARDSRAGADAKAGPLPDHLPPSGSLAGYRQVLEIMLRPIRVPVWAYDRRIVEARSLPSDEEAELNVLALLTMYNQAGVINPEAPVTGSTTATGTDITLSHPTAADHYPFIFPSLLMEISQDNNTSQLGQVVANIAGFLYGGGTPNLDPNAATTADHYATTTADWSTGSFTFVPKVKDVKAQIIVHPYKVVNAKTFLSPGMLANIDTMSNIALTCVIDTTSQPAGTLVEATALGADHTFFRRVYDMLLDMVI